MANDDFEAKLQDANYAIAGSQEWLEIVEDPDAEYYEIEVDEDDILYLIQDEDGNEIGFAVEEDGEPVEYYYAGDDDTEWETVEVIEEAPAEAPVPAVAAASDAASAPASAEAAEDEEEASILPSKEELRELAGDLKDVAMEGAQIIGEFRSGLNDLKDTLGIKDIPGSRRRW